MVCQKVVHPPSVEGIGPVFIIDLCGAVAQSGERLICTQEAKSSTLFSSTTTLRNKLGADQRLVHNQGLWSSSPQAAGMPLTS